MLDVLNNIVEIVIVEIVGGSVSPAQPHRRGKICFSFLPTSSCSTNSPGAAASNPRLTAATKFVPSSRQGLRTCLHQVVGVKPPLHGDFGQLRLFLRSQVNFHKSNLEAVPCALKWKLKPRAVANFDLNRL